jgi:CRP-like cAMP-binding protein
MQPLIGGSVPTVVAPLIRKLDKIHGLNAAERQALEKLPATLRHFAPGEDIIREGDKPTMVCMVVDGTAFRYTMVEPGRRQIMACYIAGDIPDLEGLFLDTMDHSLGVLRSCTIAQIPHDAILGIFEDQPRLGEVFWRETLIDSAMMRKWLACVGRRSALSCIAHMICEFVARMKAVGLSDGVTCHFPMTQTELGDAAGLSTVHINRSIRELRKLGLVTWGIHSVTINDWAGLARVGQFDPAYLQLPR